MSNTGTCAFCGGEAVRDQDHPGTGATVGVCPPCGTVIASWIAGKEPSTHAVGPPGERVYCDECGLPIARPASDLKRDVDGPGDDRPCHAECAERGGPPDRPEKAVTPFLAGP